MSQGAKNGASAAVNAVAKTPATDLTKRDWTALCDPRTWRELWLAQLSDFMEQYMRSPAFLTWLHCSIALDNARTRWFANPMPRPTSVYVTTTRRTLTEEKAAP